MAKKSKVVANATTTPQMQQAIETIQSLRTALAVKSKELDNTSLMLRDAYHSINLTSHALKTARMTLEAALRMDDDEAPSGLALELSAFALSTITDEIERLGGCDYE